MKTNLLKRTLTVLLTTFTLLLAACNSDNDSNTPAPGGNGDGESPALTVSTETLTLGAASGSTASFTLAATTEWSATASGEGFTFSPDHGTGDATVTVYASAANPDTESRRLGQITVTATGVAAPCTVTVIQEEPQPVELPETEVIMLDFARGPVMADPALPATTDAALTGRHEYTIDGRTYALYADGDPDINGKFFWNDQSQYSSNIPEPNKALYFSKEGAYIEFPAVDGKTLSSIEYFFSTAAGDLPDFDIQTTDGQSADFSLDYADYGTSMTFTLIAPTLNTPYRLTIVNGKNAQPARLELSYTIPQP